MPRRDASSTTTRSGGSPSASRPLISAAIVAVVCAGCLMRAPYLTDALPTSEVLNFATHDPTPAPVVSYGTPPTCSGSSVTATAVATFNAGSNTDYQWTAKLSGLTARTSYCYHVLQNGQDQMNNQAPAFTTPLASGDTTPFSFAVIGDFGEQKSPDETNVMTQLRASNPDFVVSVGDNAYPDGTQSDYGDAGSGNVFPLAKWPAGQRTPFFLAHGNHGFDDATPYLQNFPQPVVAATSSGRYQQDTYCCLSVMPQSKTFASAWYAFDWGNARFYVLEAAWSDSFGDYQGDFQAHWNGAVSGCEPCGQELQWLKSDLAAHASTPLKFAFFHYPLHSDVFSDTDTYLDGSTGLEGVLANAGVKAVFNGHSHVYERNAPQIPNTPMVSYITGNGGNDLEPVTHCSSFDAYAVGTGSSCHAPVPTSDSQVFGFLRVSVSGNRFTVAPTDENGNTFDVQTYTF